LKRICSTITSSPFVSLFSSRLSACFGWMMYHRSSAVYMMSTKLPAMSLLVKCSKLSLLFKPFRPIKASIWVSNPWPSPSTLPCPFGWESDVCCCVTLRGLVFLLRDFFFFADFFPGYGAEVEETVGEDIFKAAFPFFLVTFCVRSF